ncbi:MAG TPA: hypothetical protein VF522_14280 [Ramlibacter sp.]|uniref:hypothetical protein n=1 Tax=Ramlibacter sp. TaxID=1917967 RepID=UPI002ED16268
MQQQVRSLASAFSLHRLRIALAALMAAVTVSIVSPPAHANPAAKATEREFAEAVEQFKQGKRSLAFGKFIRLANRGDVDAARIALFMHGYGPTLWGAHWEADREDVEYWATLVRNSATAGRPQPAFDPVAVVPKVKVKQVRSSTPVVVGRSSGE